MKIYLNTFLRYTLWCARVQNIWPDGPKMGAVKNRSCTKELKSDISCHTSQRSARCLAIRTTCVCTTAQLHNCTTAQLHNCTTAQPHNCTSAPHVCAQRGNWNFGEVFLQTLGFSCSSIFFINSIWWSWFTWCAIFHIDIFIFMPILNAFTRQILKSWWIFWIVLEHR